MPCRRKPRTRADTFGPHAGPELLNALLDASDESDAVRQRQARCGRELSAQGSRPLEKVYRDEGEEEAR
eukprot:8217831-Alexandrium_andersonii.AAC.1